LATGIVPVSVTQQVEQTMESMSTWEMLLVGVVVVLVLFWVGPGIKPMLEQSRHAEKDWAGLLVPMIAVILFVILLVSMV